MKIWIIFYAKFAGEIQKKNENYLNERDRN